jgi:TP901 family phage tail tape measure protein
VAKQDVELQFKLIDGVSKGLASIQQGVTGLGASLVKVNQAAELTGKAFGAISSVAGAFGDAIQGAATVEDALTRVNTITRATVEEQAALQEAVRGAVDGTRFSAEEAAGALVLLAEDGFSAKEAVDQLGSVLQFAQANAQSAAQATAALGAVLDTYGEKPAIIGELADKLTAVAIGAGTSTKALQEGLAGVGNAADQAGLSLDETIGYLGLLASRGIEGGAAVGNFNRIIRELADPASKAGKEIKALGVDAGDFAGVLSKLGNDSVAAEKVLSALGRKPREALRVLLQEGGGDLGKFRQILDESAGASKAASDALNENFAGALERIQNQLALTRNELLTPILLPLAEEISAIGTRLSDFAKTPEFDAIIANFTEFSTAGIKAIGDFVASINFEEALGKIVAFVADAKAAFDVLVVVVKSAATTIASIAKSLDAFLEVTKYLREFNSAVNDAINPLSKLAAVQGLLGKNSEQTAKSLEKSSAEIKTSRNFILDAAQAFGQAAVKVDELGAAAVAASEDVAIISSPSKDAKDELIKLSGGAEQAALGLERFRLAALVAAQAMLFKEGQQGTDTFRALTAEIGKTEASITAMQAGIDKAAASQDALADKTDRASQSLRNFAGAAAGAADAADNVSSSNSQVSESFGNIGNQSSSAAIGLGNLTEAYVREALAAAGSAKSAREYIDTLNQYFNAGADIEQQILGRLNALRGQNEVLSEEDQIRARLIDKYGNSSRLIEELVQAELKLAQAKKRTNDEAQRGIEIEDRRTGQAGGFGAAQPTAEANPRGSVGGRGDAPATVVNVQIEGLTAAGVREVTPLIERELSRLGALRR